jgi:hypothetical protein
LFKFCLGQKNPVFDQTGLLRLAIKFTNLAD